ncbi:Histidine phosphatase superfamily,Histidine phosphatase superfamily, clade-2,Histidine acid [Cinara cedri]|uniref:acid phosphatase n=1 Tax=Cinara cedri TaxID=506608 RepID=A0A5E4M9A0_9HEMI|nr:Histidine phosphatase superfamily,Histidine phosphatase superfamily, clade-2,Histidine acid [Cinara cedri]
MIYSRFKYFIFFLIIVESDCVSKIDTQHNFQLKFVFILMRHMNRAPVIEYCKNDVVKWPHGLSALTDEGIWNAYRAGQKLRKRYIGFLDSLRGYTPDEIVVSTTPVERCYQTAGYLLAGMYPPNVQQTWNKQLKWQPIPIKTSLSKDHQSFTRNPRMCPTYAAELHNATETFMKTDSVQKLINSLKMYTSKPLNTWRDVLVVADAILTEHLANYSIPNFTMEQYSNIEEYILSVMKVLVKTDKMKRLFSGDMLNDVLTRMEASMNKSLDAKKIYLHVGHDSTIIPFFKTLNIENITHPHFGAAIIMELYITPSNETVVKLLYNKDHKWKESDIKLIELPGCPQPCRLEDWRTHTNKMIPGNLFEECNITNNN